MLLMFNMWEELDENSHVASTYLPQPQETGIDLPVSSSKEKLLTHVSFCMSSVIVSLNWHSIKISALLGT